MEKELTQTQRDTERAAARTSKGGAQRRNAATQRDTERANSRLLEHAQRVEALNASATSVDDAEMGEAPASVEPFVSADTPYFGGGGGGLLGIEIIWADQTPTFVRGDDLLDGYDADTAAYWSLVLTIGKGVFDKTLTYDSTEDLFEDDGGTPAVQTKYRLRLITKGKDADGYDISTPISMYGQYREVTTCINGEPFQRLAKVT